MFYNLKLKQHLIRQQLLLNKEPRGVLICTSPFLKKMPDSFKTRVSVSLLPGPLSLCLSQAMVCPSTDGTYHVRLLRGGRSKWQSPRVTHRLMLASLLKHSQHARTKQLFVLERSLTAAEGAGRRQAGSLSLGGIKFLPSWWPG